MNSAPALTPAGVSPFDEDVYRAVLVRHTAGESDLVAVLGAEPGPIADALERLAGHGLVARMAGTEPRYAAVEPATAVSALVRTRAAELDRVQRAAAELSRMFATAVARDSDAVELLTGREALGTWFVRVQQEAHHEVMTLDRPPYALKTSNPVEETAMERGVAYRAIYAPEALEWPGVRDDIMHLIARGEQARVLRGLRVKVAIADRKIAIMPLALDLAEVRAVVIRPSTLLDALIDLWDSSWSRALPLSGPADDTLTDDDRKLLTLLVGGLKDEAIARQLDWSIRTMRRRMSRLHEILGAANRFQAGVIAARRGLL